MVGSFGKVHGTSALDVLLSFTGLCPCFFVPHLYFSLVLRVKTVYVLKPCINGLALFLMYLAIALPFPVSASLSRRLVTVLMGALLAVLLVACSPKTELISGLEENDANQIVEVLAAHDISAVKSPSKTGFIVQVPSDTFALSLILMKQAGLPRKAKQSLGELFQKSGMVSSPVEEKARYLFAISQELESTLMSIDGVLQARVHPVLPERLTPGEPPIPASCSVLIKYNSRFDVPVYRDRIASIVTNAVPGLSSAGPTAVSIVFIPSENSLIYSSSKVQDLKEMSRNISSEVSQTAPWYLYAMVIISGLSFFGLVGFAVYYQNKARRKATGQGQEQGNIAAKPDEDSFPHQDFQDTLIENRPPSS